MSKPIQTCILGTGLSGLTFHAPFILALPELFTLHSVLERSPKASSGKLNERFGVSVKIHNSIDQVVADEDVELVIVGTPSDTHYAFAKSALEAGKHVLVDKPVTATAAEAKELGEIAKQKGLVLYAFQNRRWDSDFLALRRLLDLPKSSPESLGDVVEFESHYDRYRNSLRGSWKDEGRPATGQTYDLGTHLIDQTLVLFGRPAKLTAFLQNVRGLGNPKLDDTFTIIMQYPAGSALPYPLTAILRAHVLSVKSPQLRYLVRGTKGTYTKYGLDVQEDQLKAMTSPQEIYQEGFGIEPASLGGMIETVQEDQVTVNKTSWPSTEAGCYIELFKNLAGAIRENAELAVKWEEATAVIEMVELAHKSSEEGVTIML